MAFGTLRPYALVFAAVYGEIIGVVLGKLSRHPIGIGGMTGGAIIAKACTHVIGIEGALEIGLVAGRAVIGGIGKVAAGMTTRAILYLVAFRQWEKVVIDLIGMPVRRMQVVAFEAILRKPRLGMVGVGGVFEILEVATTAIIAQTVEAQRGFAGMALVATHGKVYAGERKTIILMQFCHIVNYPVIGRMAAGTVIAHCLLMDVGMAGDTIGAGLLKYQRLVAVFAIDGNVRTF